MSGRGKDNKHLYFLKKSENSRRNEKMKHKFKTIWTEEQVRVGFERFFQKQGRLPTAPEIDKISYLPASRTIQRRFGGLEKIRKKLGYAETKFGLHFGKGRYRSTTVVGLNKAALAAERRVERLLIKKFGEPFVHVEKRVGEGKNRVDFFVYSESVHFGIEVIYPGSFENLQKNINLKIDRYTKIHFFVIFLVANKNYSQKRINKWLANKKKSLPKKCRVYSLEVFKKWIKNLKPFPNPLQKTTRKS